MTPRIYITTSIPYVNAPPHLGHALELVQADAIARYCRLIGHEVRLQTGTDENALKNVVAARQQGITPRELVDRNSQAFRDLCRALCVSPDTFIRTTEQRHRVGAAKFWQQLRPGDIYQKEYRGLYCTGCEDFFLERDLTDGCCPDHGTRPVVVEESNYFFRLSAYQAEVEELLETDRISVIPQKRKNEVLAFVRRGLRDFSVSRDARRSGGWGIPVPGDPSQIIYVWIDALANYISGLGFGSGDGWTTFWSEETTKVHVIGKNVWKFHAVYWPAMLLSAGLPLPDRIVVHGFLTVNGQKISKSRGNAVDAREWVGEYGADAVRYYLLRAVPPFEDGDVSAERLKRLYNQDLANGLGNLLSRLSSLRDRAHYGQYSPGPPPAAPDGYVEAIGSYEFDRALAALWTLISELNRDIERARPWVALRTGDRQLVRRQLSGWLHELHRVGHWLSPLLPDASRRLLAALSRRERGAPEVLFPRSD